MDGKVMLIRFTAKCGVYLPELRCAIDMRLALAEEIQIWSM
jgi:hypothetical protein